MILYNVTVSVDAASEKDWLQWMKEIHLPEILATGHFAEAKIARILAEEQGGKAYSVQYFAHSMEAYEAYEKDHAPDCGLITRKNSDRAPQHFAPCFT